jgi:hypothetical protein
MLRHSHRRDYPSLRRQLHAYGVGLGAALTKCLIDKPARAPALAARLPAGLAYLLDPASPKNRRKRADFPRELPLLELRGLLAGPAAYLRSRRSSERPGKKAPNSWLIGNRLIFPGWRTRASRSEGALGETRATAAWPAGRAGPGDGVGGSGGDRPARRRPPHAGRRRAPHAPRRAVDAARAHGRPYTAAVAARPGSPRDRVAGQAPPVGCGISRAGPSLPDPGAAGARVHAGGPRRARRSPQAPTVHRKPLLRQSGH